MSNMILFTVLYVNKQTRDNEIYCSGVKDYPTQTKVFVKYLGRNVAKQFHPVVSKYQVKSFFFGNIIIPES